MEEQATKELSYQEILEAGILQESFEAGRHVGRREGFQMALAEFLKRQDNADKEKLTQQQD